MEKNLTRSAQRALGAAADEARSLGTSYTGSEHLLLGLLSEDSSVAANILRMHEVTYTATRRLAQELAGDGSGTGAEMTPGLRRIIKSAAETAARHGNACVGTEDLLLSILYDKECVAVKLILSQNASISELQNDILSFYGELGVKKDDKPKRFESTHSLSVQYGRDMTFSAKIGALDPLIGREREVERVIAILSRRQKNNPCLIGEPGVGKTAVVEGLCERIAEENVPETLIGKNVFMLDLGAMIAGAKYRGEFEERLKKIMEEIIKNKNTIVFIDEIHTIVGAGAAEGAVDAANILKPYLARGELQIIGATTLEEYRRHIEKDAALERRFQPVVVNEPSVDETIKILLGIREKYERFHNVKISDEAIAASVRLSKRYIPERFLPDKAIDLIDEASAIKRMESRTVPEEIRREEERARAMTNLKESAIRMQNFEEAAKYRDGASKAEARAFTMKRDWKMRRDSESLTVTEDDIAAAITLSTGTPIGRIKESESSALLRIEENISKKLVGQSEAIASCARAIRRGRTGFSGKNRPLCSLLFVGGSGVGKTELAHLIAEELFGSRDQIVKIDMSEYMERHSVSRLVGSPPGYVGFGEGGKLTERVRRNPYSVVLFDEIEKAHPDVLGILLQILDAGVLTDSEGRRADFKSSVIIMTSNVGTSYSLKKSGFVIGREEVREKSMSALKDTFRPELIGRIDEIVFFEPLGPGELARIVRMMLGASSKNAAELGITVEFDDGVFEAIAKKAGEKSLGARPLRSIIGKEIEDVLSSMILSGEVNRGDRIKCREAGGAFRFEKDKAVVNQSL